jgi:RND family efflux transporter MFP subunit
VPDASPPRSLAKYGAGAAAIALAIVAIGIGSRVHADHRLAAIAAEDAVPTVTVIRPDKAGTGNELALPGNIEGFNSAALHARTNGYVRRWLVDIGDQVRAGQTLAIIDAPEVDQQLAQARAAYQTAAANERLARTTARRWDTLLAKDAVSRQEADEKRGDLAAKAALADAASAQVRQLQAQLGFTQIRAPFAGVVTSRSAQIGALTVAGSAASQPLYTIADVDRLRIYVHVPQGYSAQLHPGMHATLGVPEYPGRSFDAVMTRSAGAVDVSSGTVLVELYATNPDRALKPGSYAQVHFALPANTTVTLPASALIVREDGTLVATVGADNRIRLKPIHIARDDGATVEVSTGISGNERIVDSPPDTLANGDQVRIQAVSLAKAGS